jgi:hypothetical protein
MKLRELKASYYPDWQSLILQYEAEPNETARQEFLEITREFATRIATVFSVPEVESLHPADHPIKRAFLEGAIAAKGDVK